MEDVVASSVHVSSGAGKGGGGEGLGGGGDGDGGEALGGGGDSDGGDGDGRIYPEHPSPILHAPGISYPVRANPSLRYNIYIYIYIYICFMISK